MWLPPLCRIYDTTLEGRTGMRCWMLAASLLAAALPTGAIAADLDQGPAYDRRGTAYEDPRYADIYRYPDRPAPPPYARPPLPREPIYRDDERDYHDKGDYRGPPRYSYADPRAPHAARCVPREEVRYRLTRLGWHDFHDVDLRGELATVRARRPSGRLFDLTIDRCSGEIVDSRPLEARPYGPYAYGAPPPRRWDRAY